MTWWDSINQLKPDAVHQVLELAKRMIQFYPDRAVSYDDASNNRALVSGRSALMFNPPTAWAVAAKGEVGLDQYEVRFRVGWHRTSRVRSGSDELPMEVS